MDSEQDMSALGARNESEAGAGALLRRAREAQGLSLAEIGTRTRIPIRQLEVIEAGAFASLPSRTYAIGFARTYARALGLDEAQVTAAVRAELGDASEPRSIVPGGMEPGDPAKLPSSALAWAGGIAALLLAAGLFAWFSSQFRAGEGAAPLVAAPEAAPVTAERAPPTDDGAPASGAVGAGGTVVFTALEDGVWVRLFDEGGERFLEKTLAKGESFTVPPGARDPRINTARPDALTLTIDGKPAAPLAVRAVVLASEPVSAAALRARGAPAAGAAAAGGLAAPIGQAAAAGSIAQPRPRAERAQRRRAAVPAEAAMPTATASDAAPLSAPSSAPAPAPAATPAASAAAGTGEG
jgi:transcriptional regulator with XRE-family HTH domain